MPELELDSVERNEDSEPVVGTFADSPRRQYLYPPHSVTLVPKKLNNGSFTEDDYVAPK